MEPMSRFRIGARCRSTAPYGGHWSAAGSDMAGMATNSKAGLTRVVVIMMTAFLCQGMLSPIR